jgi:hypothetical protein
MGQEAAYRPFGGIFHEMAPATRPGPISQTSATDSLPPVGFGALGESLELPRASPSFYQIRSGRSKLGGFLTAEPAPAFGDTPPR